MATRATLTETLEVEGLFTEFFDNSNVGLAVFDQHLCYSAVNDHLASMHGVSPECHIGKHVREILGAVATQVEAALNRVFATGSPIINRPISGHLPTKPGDGHWIDNIFPLADPNGRITRVGVIVLELPWNTQLVSAMGPAPAAGTVLRSWKDIAGYLGSCVKTVQRWEQAYGLPVRRLNPHKGAVVYALRSEVDDWLLNRSTHAKTSVP